MKDDTSFSIPELCELSSLRNSRRAKIFAGEQERDKLGDKLGNKLGGKLGNKLEDKLGDKRDKTVGRWTHPPTKGNKKEDKLVHLVHKLGDKRDKDLGRRTNHPTKGKKKGDVGDKGEDGHITQQRETRTMTSWETSWETRPREDARTIQETETRRETSWKADTKGNKKERQPGKLGDKLGDKGQGGQVLRKAHHPTKGNKKGDNGR